ncbi:PUA-like domain-containing protein [Ochromonadaceae sp. CCMP2298]|nr:PUA-like domain-containing protein [Ochromonadaceae sp. CCMP2298]
MARCWLLKSEPHEYGIDHLQAQKVGRWDGIRNFQARNSLREMSVDDVAYFYHSSCKQPGIYGRMTIAKTHYDDPTALDTASPYYFPKATPESNPWSSVDVAFACRYSAPLLLPRIKELSLGACPLVSKGSRLSVMPITPEQWEVLEGELRQLNEQQGQEQQGQEQQGLKEQQGKKGVQGQGGEQEEEGKQEEEKGKKGGRKRKA